MTSYQDKDVGRVPHLLAAEDDDEDEEVAQHTHNHDDGKDDRHDQADHLIESA